jgi:hypothetical protein
MDVDFVDRRGGRDWSDRCFFHIRAGRYGYARAACDKGLALASCEPWWRLCTKIDPFRKSLHIGVMADFNKRAPGFDNCEGGEGERGERGERGKRGKRGHTGATGPTGPAAESTPPFWPPFADPPVLNIIYANQTGSDETGDGSQANPYLTLQRAVRDLPLHPAQGQFYRVDVTNLGTEVLPPNYALPTFLAPYGGEATLSMPPALRNTPFTTMTQLEILAIPKPVASLGGGAFIAAAVVTVDNDTALIKVATGNAYADDTLKGKLLKATLPGGEAIVGVIWHNQGGDLYVSHAYVPDAAPTFNAFTPLPQAPFTIMEQSAELVISSGASDLIKGAFQIANTNSFSMRGIKFTKTNPSALWGVQLWRSSSIVFDACDMPGFSILCGSTGVFVSTTYIHDGLVILQGCVGFYQSYFRNIPSMLTPMSGCAGCVYMVGFVAEQCAAIGPRYNPFEPADRGPCGCLDARYGAIFNAIPDQFVGVIADPSTVWTPAPIIAPANTLPGYGIYVKGGCLALDHVKIWGCQSDGIHAEICPGCNVIKSVTGGEGGLVFGNIPNAPNGQLGGGPITDPNAVGLFLTDGAHFLVTDNFPGVIPLPPAAGIVASSVTGVAGDLRVGDLGVKSWVGLSAQLPQKRFIDLTYDPTLGAPTEVTGSGSWIMQKP